MGRPEPRKVDRAASMALALFLLPGHVGSSGRPNHISIMKKSILYGVGVRWEKWGEKKKNKGGKKRNYIKKLFQVVRVLLVWLFQLIMMLVLITLLIE